MTTSKTIDASDHDDFEPAPPDKLYAHYCRQLSAMMDGELSPDEAKFMLRRLEHDGALAGCWERWQICGDVLRGRRHALLPADFAQRVASAIDDDGRAVLAVSAAKPRPRIARWGSGAALAASVAVVAFLVSRQLPGETADPPAASTEVVAQVPAAQAPIATAPISIETAPRAATGTSTPEAGVALATAAVAASEAPRRAAERRSRARNGQRASDRLVARDIPEQSPVVAAADQPALVLPTTDPLSSPVTDAFAARSMTPVRPWPRAILPGYAADGALSASYGDVGAAPNFDFFAPSFRVDPAQASRDADVDGVPAGTEARDGTTPR